MDNNVVVGIASYKSGATCITRFSIPNEVMKTLMRGRANSTISIRKHGFALVIGCRGDEYPVRMANHSCYYKNHMEGSAGQLFKAPNGKVWCQAEFKGRYLVVHLTKELVDNCNFERIKEVDTDLALKLNNIPSKIVDRHVVPNPNAVVPKATQSRLPPLTALESSKYKLEYDYKEGECWFRDTIIARKTSDYGTGEEGWNAILDHLRKNGVLNPPSLETLMRWENGKTLGPKLKTMAPIACAMFGYEHRIIKAFDALIG